MARQSRYRPSSTLRSLQSEVNRLFDDIFPSREGSGSVGTERRGWSPQVDVMETGQNYRLRVDLPGVSHNDVTINVEENQLTVRGERSAENQQTDETILRSERHHGHFYRSLTLPAEINPDKARANFKDGVLVIDLPKVTKSTEKTISIS